jgi:antitoxin ParD1/3/4/toxin ParE1/3/4
VARYRLTSRALRDLTSIVKWLSVEATPAIALRTEDNLFELFDSLARNPGIGHRRHDLTPRNVLFFPLRPYLVVYEPTAASPILIHAVLHSARDLQAILGSRLR